MKIPRSLYVLGRMYTIKRSKLDGLEGLCDPANGQILINVNICDEELYRTLMHELFHAYQYETGLVEILDEQALEMHAETSAAFICNLIKIQFR